MKQLNKISQDGILMANGSTEKVNLFECHDLVFICSLVCNNNVSPMGNDFCPWCMCQKIKTIHMVTGEITNQRMGVLQTFNQDYAVDN